MSLLNLFLGLAWIFLTGVFTFANLCAGLALGFAILHLLKNTSSAAAEYVIRAQAVCYLLVMFFYQLTRANLKIAWEVLTPTQRMTPGIVAVPLYIKGDFGITLLANLITLTPGTLSVDVSEDGTLLYVHSMYVKDPEHFKSEIKNGFERMLLNIFSQDRV